MHTSKHEERKERWPVISLTNSRKTSQGPRAAVGSSRPSSVRVLLPLLLVLWFQRSAPAPPRVPGVTVSLGARARALVGSVARLTRRAVARQGAASPARRAAVGRAVLLAPARPAARRPSIWASTAAERARSARPRAAACSLAYRARLDRCNADVRFSAYHLGQRWPFRYRGDPHTDGALARRGADSCPLLPCGTFGTSGSRWAGPTVAPKVPTAQTNVTKALE